MTAVAARMTEMSTPLMEFFAAKAQPDQPRRGSSSAALADELAIALKVAPNFLGAFDDTTRAGPSPGGFDFTLGDGVEALWYDAHLHGDDIRPALRAGRPSRLRVRRVTQHPPGDTLTTPATARRVSLSVSVP